MADICLINALFPPHAHGGAENYVLRTAQELDKRGHNVTIITTEPYEDLSSLRPTQGSYEGITTWRFYPPNLSHLSDGTGTNPITKAIWRGIDSVNVVAARTVGKILDRVDPDVVHTNNLLGISSLVGTAVQRRNLRHIHTLHDYSLICPRGNLLKKLTAPDGERRVCENPPTPCRLYAKQRRSALGSPDIVTGPSQHVIDIHLDHGFFASSDSSRQQLGVSRSRSKPPSPADLKSILYVGKQLESKGLATLFEAAKGLPEIKFHICGRGPYQETTEEVAERQPNITYHGYVTKEKLQQLRGRVGAAVVPSIWMENSPLTIYESFSAGVPVVASDIGGIPELVKHGETGLLFEPQNVTDLQTQLTEITSDPKTNQVMRENALRWSREHTLSSHVDVLEEKVYQVRR